VTCPNCRTPLASEARFCPACGFALAVTSSATDLPVAQRDLVGREIGGNYRILAKLGEGGMGAVYRGEQISLRRPVAVKVLRPELSRNEVLLRRFQAEAQVIARISHPNTVSIYDFGQDSDGSLFIAMEFIEGRSLRTVVSREAPLPSRRALHIAAQIAASIADAHGRSIVHRDLKPDNVMLQERGRDRDVVRVLDFGIAKLRDEGRQTQQQMTQAGDMLGTPQYMAPEQIRGEAIDGRVDIYALGCMIYEMVTGRMAFEAPTVMAMLSKHLVEMPMPPSVRRPDLALPAAIDRLVLTAMQKDPAARPSTMDLYGEQIAAALAAMPLDAAHAAASGPRTRTPTPVPPSLYGDPNAAAVSPAPGYPSPSPYAAPPSPTAPAYPAPALGSVAGAASAQGTPAPVGMAYAPPRARSRVGLYAGLAVLGLGAIGVAAWQLAKNAGGRSAPADAAAPSGPDPWSAAKPDPWAGGAATPATAADAGAVAVAPAADAGAVAVAPAADAGAVAPAADAAPVALYPVDLPEGVHLATPPGFTRDDQKTAELVVDRKDAVFIGVEAVGPASASVPTIASTYATKLGLHYDGRYTAVNKGASRDVLLYSGTMQTYGAIDVMSVVYPEGDAVVVVSVGARPAQFAKLSFRELVLGVIERNLTLP
jgi:serine/threonine-protein kinase